MRQPDCPPPGPVRSGSGAPPSSQTPGIASPRSTTFQTAPSEGTGVPVHGATISNEMEGGKVWVRRCKRGIPPAPAAWVHSGREPESQAKGQPDGEDSVASIPSGSTFRLSLRGFTNPDFVTRSTDGGRHKKIRRGGGRGELRYRTIQDRRRYAAADGVARWRVHVNVWRSRRAAR